ncbi:MAG: hypothetical protein WCS18_11595 [Sphaerochaetaceae bacterium]
MKETTAFALVKKLKAAGYDVSMKDAPAAFVPPKGYDDLAVVGAAGMAPKAAEACLKEIRKGIVKSCDGYTIEKAGDKNRKFADASFAAW